MAFNTLEGNGPVSEYLSKWSKESISMLSGGLDTFKQMNRAWLEMGENPSSATPLSPEAFLNFSKNWLEGYSRMYRTWMESVQTIGEACRAVGRESNPPERILKTCGEVSQRFASEWLSFVSDQSRSFMNLREACFSAGKPDAPKGKRDGGAS